MSRGESNQERHDPDGLRIYTWSEWSKLKILSLQIAAKVKKPGHHVIEEVGPAYVEFGPHRFYSHEFLSLVETMHFEVYPVGDISHKRRKDLVESQLEVTSREKVAGYVIVLTNQIVQQLVLHDGEQEGEVSEDSGFIVLNTKDVERVKQLLQKLISICRDRTIRNPQSLDLEWLLNQARQSIDPQLLIYIGHEKEED